MKLKRSEITRTWLFSCNSCVYHKAGYIILCSSFLFTLTNYFSCNKKDAIYILICETCKKHFILDKLKILNKELHKSDSTKLHTSTCRICLEHLRDCNQAEPYFQIFPFYYETNTILREYKEKQHILRWKPLLNQNKR